MTVERRTTVLRVVALICVVALMVLLFIFRHEVRRLKQYGYVGIFLISIAANATVIIPLPGVALTAAMGAIFNPLELRLQPVRGQLSAN